MGVDPMNRLLLYRGCARQPFGLRIRRLNFRECQCVFDISERRRFVIESGALECYIKKDDGSELMVKTVEAGDAFGELALLSARGTGVQENDPLGGAAKQCGHTKSRVHVSKQLTCLSSSFIFAMRTVVFSHSFNLKIVQKSVVANPCKDPLGQTNRCRYNAPRAASVQAKDRCVTHFRRMQVQSM